MAEIKSNTRLNGKKAIRLTKSQLESIFENGCAVNSLSGELLRTVDRIDIEEVLSPGDCLVIRALLAECYKRGGRLIDLHNKLTGHPQ